MIARELLEKDSTKVGDVVKFKDGVIGLVIGDWDIKKDSIVNNKAILLTNYLSGKFWGDIARGHLNIEAKIIKKVNYIKTK